MTQSAAIISHLKTQGYRITRLRHELVEIFSGGCRPLAYDELLLLLSGKGLVPNKTTLYRELDFLLAQGVIQDLDLGEGKKRYEASGDHHHHLVCTGCDEIEAIHLDHHLCVQEQNILHKKGFKVTRHMLEFFGMCRKCQTKG